MKNSNKQFNKKQYTSEEKFAYHKQRERACGKFGIKFGSPKQCYSSGFIDAFSGHNNMLPTTREFGKKSGKAYLAGYNRGTKASREYFNRTGKQPSNLV